MILLIQERDIFIVFVFDFFHQSLVVSCIQVFCLLRLVYFYVFYTFVAMVNGIVSLISIFVSIFIV